MSNQLRIVAFTAISLVIIFFVGSYAYKSYKNSEIKKMAREDKTLFEREYSYSVGSKDAKVHIVEFFDPACETCAAFHPFIKDIMKKNEGKIRLTYRYAPYHQGSDYVVKILEAARKQGKFMETLEMMFATQKYWASHHNPNPKLLWQFLPRLGLDVDKLAQDMQDPKLDKIIAQDLNDAKKLGVTKTPSYFVNTKPLQTFGYEPLKKLIYSEL